MNRLRVGSVMCAASVLMVSGVAAPGWAAGGRGGARSTAATVSAPGAYQPVTPSRLLDTRVGTGAAMGAVAARSSLTLQVAGRGGVPAAGAGEVVLALTVTDATSSGYLTAYEGGGARPVTSNLNFASGRTVANQVTVPLSASGTVSIYNGSSGTVQLVADVAGYYLAGTPTAAGAFTPTGPTRLLDTRVGTGATAAAVKSHATLSLQVAGSDGLPANGMSAVVLNVTVTSATRSGEITVFPTGVVRPTTSNLNFVAGQTIANLVTVQLGPDGQVDLYDGSVGTVALIADVAGYFRSGMPTAAGTFVPLTPLRVVDTRSGIGIPKESVPAHTSEAFPGQGRGPLPETGIGSVVLNVTVTTPSHSGYLTAYTSGIERPATSNLDFAAGATVATEAIVPPGIDGNLLLYNGSAGTVEVIADVEGYYLGSDRPGAGVWVWGDNSSGQLGDGTTTASPLPVHVSGLDNVVAAAQGFQRVTALRADGTVWEWGDRDFANGGDPPTVLTEHPVQVPGLSGITAIADSDYSGYALRSDGTMWAWGYNDLGQLGDGTRTTHLTPEQIPGLTGVVAISATLGDTAYAVKSDGTLWSWGYGGSGELGIGAVDNSNSPVQVALTGVVGTAGPLALRSDGTVWAWGRDYSGEAGQGTSGPDVLTPVQVHNLSGVTAIAQNDKALTSDGVEFAWGSNDVGDLGIGSLTHSDLPVRVGGVSHVVSLGNAFGAVTADGTAWNWGFNGYNAIGDGSATTPVESPVRVAGLAGVTGMGNDSFNGFAVIPDS